MVQISFAELREQYADYFARAASIYNVNPLLGRLYAYLLLSPQPMSLGELATTAGAAKSTVSVVIRTLEHYRLVDRQLVKGDRRDYFTARTDSALMLRELYDLFFSRELEYYGAANKTARQALEAAPIEGDWPDQEQRALLIRRMTQLESFANVMSDLLKQFMNASDKPVSPVELIPIEVENE